MYHWHDEKEPKWEPGVVRSGAGVGSSGVSVSSGDAPVWGHGEAPNGQACRCLSSSAFSSRTRALAPSALTRSCAKVAMCCPVSG